MSNLIFNFAYVSDVSVSQIEMILLDFDHLSLLIVYLCQQELVHSLQLRKLNIKIVEQCFSMRIADPGNASYDWNLNRVGQIVGRII